MNPIQDYLQKIDAVIQAGPYSDTWESLAEHPTAKWYQQARFGFFIHWGIYSVPAYITEWYPRFMYHRQNPIRWHHLRHYGRNFDYHDFIPQFTAERFDADKWLSILKDCSADFIMPVAEHHDGFKMYRSELNRWNAAEMGPKRDVLGELNTACQKRGVLLAASSHRAEHYWFMNGGATLGEPNATQLEAYRDFYGPCATADGANGIKPLWNGDHGIVPTRAWLEDWLTSSCEIVDRYHPSAFYFDSWASSEWFRPYMRKFLAYYFNRAAQRGQEVVTFCKWDGAPYPIGIYVRERGQIEGISPTLWQCETSTSKIAWCYVQNNRYKDAGTILCNMIDVWSKNGRMVLNIGPRADGSICNEEMRLLRTIGAWLRKNREAIWGTGPYKVFGEGKKQKAAAFKENYHYTAHDFRFTYRLGHLYAFALVPQGETVFRIRQVAPRAGACNAIVRHASILGEEVRVTPRQTAKYLELTLDRPVEGDLPVCFKLDLE